MASNSTERAREILESGGEGWFAGCVERCLSAGGVVHLSPECFLAGEPCADDAGCLYIVFACGDLCAVRRLLVGLGVERVRWKREYKYGQEYGVRERAVADFCRHEDFGTGLTKKK